MSKGQCCTTVYPRERFGSFHGYRCQKPAKVERDGKLYCAVHDPEAVKQREQAQRDKLNTEWEMKEAAHKRDAIMRKLCDGIPTEELEHYELVRKGADHAE